jgi:uncharacterized membrane protein
MAPVLLRWNCVKLPSSSSTDDLGTGLRVVELAFQAHAAVLRAALADGSAAAAVTEAEMIDARITIKRPAESVFAFYRDFGNLPR